MIALAVVMALIALARIAHNLHRQAIATEKLLSIIERDVALRHRHLRPDQIEAALGDRCPDYPPSP